MTRGASAARQKYLITVPELRAGEFDYGGAATFAADLNTDGTGLDFVQRYAEHKPDGFLSLSGAALVGDEGQFQGTFMPHYELMEFRLRAICGAPVETTLGDGRRQLVFKLPEFGRVNRETFSGYYGAEEIAYELLYGKIMSLSMESVRSGDVGGSMTMHFNRIRRGLAMYGAAAANAQFTIEKNGATGDLEVDVSVNGGAAQTLTVADDDVAADVQTSLIALSNVVTATCVDVDGVFVCTITDPVNTRVSAYKATGAAGWVVTNTVLGSSGIPALSMPDGEYIESSHGLVYFATDYADLQSIDMGDDEDYVHDDPHIIDTIQGHTFSLDALVNPLYFEDRTLNPASHVDGETNISSTFTMPEDNDGPANNLFNLAYGCSVTPFFSRQAWRCGPREFWFDMYGGRNDAPSSANDQNVAQWVFNQRRFYNANGSAVFTLRLPA